MRVYEEFSLLAVMMTRCDVQQPSYLHRLVTVMLLLCVGSLRTLLKQLAITTACF